MLLKAHKIGIVKILNKKIDITDPCYNRNVWCRLNNVTVKSGEYICRYYVGSELEQKDIREITEIAEKYGHNVKDAIEREKADIKQRCFVIEFHLNGYNFCQDSPEWKEIGEIGVDAGLAGFFWNKPDFTDSEWNEFCDKLDKNNEVAYLDEGMGFWCSSGYGDGIYKVYAIKDEREIVALKICF